VKAGLEVAMLAPQAMLAQIPSKIMACTPDLVANEISRG
jgi:hypothetical protein